MQSLLMRALLLNIAGLLFGRHATAQEPGPITRDSLQSILNARVTAGSAPGLIVGVVNAGRERVVAAAGSARPGVPVNEHTVFEFAAEAHR